MEEVNVEVLKSDVDHMKVDINDIKATAKEQGNAMLSMRDSHTETRIYINQIRESQTTMAKEVKDNQENLSKDAKENHKITMLAIQEIKDEKLNMWKQLSMAGKIAVITLIVSYIGGTVFGILRQIAS